MSIDERAFKASLKIGDFHSTPSILREFLRVYEAAKESQQPLECSEQHKYGLYDAIQSVIERYPDESLPNAFEGNELYSAIRPYLRTTEEKPTPEAPQQVGAISEAQNWIKQARTIANEQLEKHPNDEGLLRLYMCAQEAIFALNTLPEPKQSQQVDSHQQLLKEPTDAINVIARSLRHWLSEEFFSEADIHKMAVGMKAALERKPTTQPQSQDSRSAFESHYKGLIEAYPYVDANAADKVYHSSYIQCRWEGWQACEQRIIGLLESATEDVAKAIYLKTSRQGLLWPRVFGWGEYPEQDIYFAEAKAAIEAIKQKLRNA